MPWFSIRNLEVLLKNTCVFLGILKFIAYTKRNLSWWGFTKFYIFQIYLRLIFKNIILNFKNNNLAGLSVIFYT